MDLETRLKRLRFRAWHRGTKEADLLIGGFFDRYAQDWGGEEIGWYERLLDEPDVEIMAWAIGSQPAPPAYQGPLMLEMQRLDYIPVAR